MEANWNTRTQATEHVAAAAGIHGPYWDYVAAHKWAAGKRDMWARITADSVADRLAIADCRRRAATYREFAALADRITARYESIKDTPVDWIGWDTRFISS